jgi:hypothetical protein
MKLARLLVRVLAMSAALSKAALGAPLGTEFTYQGYLEQNGVPVDGTAHLRFSLWNQAAGGAQLGASQIAGNITVSDGAFTVQLNGAGQFGANAFTGEARWIQVDVCTDAVCSSFTTLLPRQSVTAAPYARFSAAPWETNGASLTVLNRNVGIGTTTPLGPLDVRSGNGSFFYMDGINGDLHANGGNDGHFGLYNDGVSTGGTEFISQGQVRLAVRNDGNVGVGVQIPTAKLDVRGDIKLGANGQHYAAGGEENLRIVRGVVDINAGEPHGCCFSAVRPMTGVYDITFAVPFSNVPVTTATAVGPAALNGALVKIIQPTTSVVRIIFFDENGNEVNTEFNFITIGPR